LAITPFAGFKRPAVLRGRWACQPPEILRR